MLIGRVSEVQEIKNERVCNKIIVEEENQIKDLEINFYKLGFISKSGFKNDVDKSKYICFCLDDFYNFKN